MIDKDKGWRDWTDEEVRWAAAHYQELDDEQASDLAVAVGRHRYLDLADAIAPMLDHRDWAVRQETLMSLVGRLGLMRYLPAAIDAFGDEERVVAESVPMVLWRFVSRNPDRHSEIMELLVTRLLTVADPLQQRATYQAILQIGRIGEPLELDRLPFDFDLRRDVDWDPLLRWIPEDMEAPEGVISTWDVAEPGDVDVLADGTASDEAVVETAERLLLDRRQEARSPIIRLITGDRPAGVRGRLLDMYVGTWGPIDAGLLYRILTDETDPGLRLAATRALAEVDAAPVRAAEPAQFDPADRRFSMASAGLLQALRTGPTVEIREVAYRSLLATLGADDQVPDEFTEDAIDWDLIDRLTPDGA